MLLEIGLPDKPAPYMSGRPFNRCTHTALSPEDEIYVSDGYGNARVHKYSPDGRLLLSSEAQDWSNATLCGTFDETDP